MTLPNQLYVVVPLSRSERLPSVVKQFQDQFYKNARLVIVENGNGVGASRLVTLPSDTIVATSPSGMAALPRNEGLRIIQNELGGGFVTYWDDDDYYGPQYLNEYMTVQSQQPLAAIGKCMRYVRFEDGLYYCLQDDQLGLTGGACGGHSSVLPPMPEMILNEDHQWCLNLLEKGIQVINTGPRHFIYNRQVGWSDRVLRLSRQQFLKTYGPAYFYGNAPNSICHDLPVPTELVPIPSREILLQELTELAETRTHLLDEAVNEISSLIRMNSYINT